MFRPWVVVLRNTSTFFVSFVFCLANPLNGIVLIL